ncbi:hypothetical protein D3C78_310110 [compost metagenome]
MNIQTVIEQNWNYTDSFPMVHGHEVVREDILETITDTFNSPTSIVFVEGASGIGASIILAQFVKRNEQTCFSLFLSPSSRFSYDATYVRLLLAEQLKIFVDSVPFDRSAIDEVEFFQLISKARSKLRGKKAYFVVDGLSHIPKEDDNYIASIMSEVLPLGTDGFRFLFSGPQERLAPNIKSLSSKPHQLRRFMAAEAKEIFKGIELSDQEHDEIFQVCQGLPSRLSAIKRQLATGADLSSILSKNPGQHLDFVNLDFKNFESLHETEKVAIALLAFSKQNIGLEEISTIGGLERDRARALIKECTFLEVKNDNRITFISNAHRKSAEIRLSDLRGHVNDLQIKHLKESPKSDNSLLYLAPYLQQTNNNKELVELISSEHYQELLDTTQSLSQLRDRAELGIISAHSLASALHAFQFSLQKSMFIELSRSSASKSEIKALVSMDKMQHAMHLAQGAVTKSNKLWLLAAYASGLKRKNKNVDPLLLEQIAKLVEVVDLQGEEQTASQIAEDLLSVDVNLATDLLERSLNGNDVRKRDLALSRLSIMASRHNEAYAVHSAVESRIKNAAVQAFTVAFTHYHMNDSADSLLAFLEGMPDKNKIKLIIDLVATQRKRDGLVILVDYALDLIIKTTSYLPKAKDYADLCTPLRYQDIPALEIRDFVARIDGQSELIKNASVTRDWIRLSSSLAYLEAKYDSQCAYDRILGAYYDTSGMDNIEIQAECYSRLLYALRDIDPEDKFEAKEGLKSVIDADMNSAVAALLASTASQFECISPVLPAMIEHDLDKAVCLADQLNTLENRLLAYSNILETLVTKPSSPEKCASFLRVLAKISHSQTLQDSLRNCCRTAWRKPFDLGWADCLKTAVRRIKNPGVHASCAIHIFKMFERHDQPLEAKYLTDAIEILMDKTQPSPARDNICFEAVTAVSNSDPEAAERLYKKIVAQRGNPGIENESVQLTLLHALALVIRTFGAGLSRNLVDDSMLVRLSGYVSRLSSFRQQVSLYNDLACRAWIADSMLQKIVNDYCRPLLNQIKVNTEYLYLELLEIAFPSLYLAHPQSALRELESLEAPNRNSALYKTCELIRRKLTMYEPSQNDESDICQMDYQQADSILCLLEYMTRDSGIFGIIKKLTETVSHKKNKHRFTQQQKREISERLLRLINSKLPDPQSIQHDGYKICTTGFAHTLRDANSVIWKQLVEDARKIPNVADKAFVLIQLARSLPGKELGLKKEVLAEAEECSDRIPSLNDRLGRLEMYSLACKDLSVAEAKKALRKSLQLSHGIEDLEEAATIQKSLIDAADQIEPGFADTLLELFDDDPARLLAKAHAKHSVDVLKAKKDLADANTATPSVADEHLAEACWKNLSALQAYRINPKPLLQMAGLISTKSTLGLLEAYPFLCWYIENTARKCSNTEDARQNLMPICEVLLLSTELAFNIVTRKVVSQHSASAESVVGMIIKPNSRDEAVEYIQNWLNIHCVEYIKFCDPYFTNDDMELVQFIQAANPACQVHIIARASHLKSSDCASGEVFEDAWNKISDQTPPETYIYGIEKLDGKELIHDRWMLTSGSGLRIGTSINSLGAKLSEISVMTPDEFSRCQEALDQFLNNQVVINGSRVKVTRYQI